MEQIIIQF